MALVCVQAAQAQAHTQAGVALHARTVHFGPSTAQPAQQQQLALEQAAAAAEHGQVCKRK